MSFFKDFADTFKTSVSKVTNLIERELSTFVDDNVVFGTDDLTFVAFVRPEATKVRTLALLVHQECIVIYIRLLFLSKFAWRELTGCFAAIFLQERLLWEVQEHLRSKQWKIRHISKASLMATIYDPFLRTIVGTIDSFLLVASFEHQNSLYCSQAWIYCRETENPSFLVPSRRGRSFPNIFPNDTHGDCNSVGSK